MKTTTLSAAFSSAAILFSAQQISATHAHRQAHNHYEKRHGHGHVHDRTEEVAVPKVEGELVKRGSGCSLPTHSDLVSVTSSKDNKGFAMSPDQVCTHGMYCPIACRSGMVMAQWKPNTTYISTESMDGGLYCDNGVPTKPFPDQPYCLDGTGTVKAVNTCGKSVAFCQTVLPGNEAMLIPTEVSGTTTLAVPGPDYWAGTAAHYYVNPPGVSTSDGCVWGTEDKNVGNWSPYVAGANTVSDGSTYVQISWNPIYEASKWSNTVPSYGLKIECDGNCNGLPCEIDPSKTGLKGVNSNNKATGAGGANYCVVTVSKGSSARIVVFNTDGSTGSSSSSSSSSATPKATSTSSSRASPSASATTSSSAVSTSLSSSSSSQGDESATTTSSETVPTIRPGLFHENGTSMSSGYTGRPITTTGSLSTSSTVGSAASPSESKSDGVNREKNGAAVVGLIVALVAAAWLY